MKKEGFEKMSKLIASILVAVIALSIFGVVSASAVRELGSISFVVKYVDWENPNDSGLLSNIDVFLYDYQGRLIAGPVLSMPTVTFEGVPYGNYIVKVESKVIGENYAYGGKYVEVKLDSTGDNIQYVDVTRYPLNHTLNLTLYEDISNQVLKPGALVEVHTDFGLKICVGRTDANGTIRFNVPKLDLNLKIYYQEGGTTKYFYTKVNKSSLDLPAGSSVKIDLKGFRHVFGAVEDAATNQYINETIRITLIQQDGSIYDSFLFTGRTFDFHVSSGISLKMFITADGYDGKTISLTNAASQFYIVSLNKNVTPIHHDIYFSEDFKTVWINSTLVLNNYSIIDSMEYSKFGILYYQLKLTGYDDKTKLQRWFSNSIPYIPQLKVGGHNYTLVEKKVSDFNINYGGFEIKLTSKYKSDDVDIEKLLKNKGIDIKLFISKDYCLGTYRDFTYRIHIPDKYERSNEISALNISGYVSTITINDASKSDFYEIILKERTKPSLDITSSTISLYWKNMTFSTDKYVINTSKENFTIIVPANINVSINVSKSYMDNVRNMRDWQNATFRWILDNNTILAGTGAKGCNLTYNFKTGKHVLIVEAEDVGNNTNRTNITVYADGYVPTLVVNITEGKHSIISLRLNITSGKLEYKYNNTTRFVSIPVESREVNITLPQIILINESAQVLYNASETKDTFNGTSLKKISGNIFVEWDFNGTKSTEINKTYAFDKPTRGNNTVWINLTARDLVNNTIRISIKAKILDKTPPDIKVKIFNKSWKEVMEIDEGNIVYLDAKNTSDPEGGNVSSYNWTIMKSAGGIAKLGEEYEIVNGTLQDDRLVVRFLKYGLYYIILNVTDVCGNHAIKNISFHVNPVRPDISITNVSFPNEIIEGNPVKIKITLKNNGKVNVTKFTISLYANDKLVINKAPYSLLIKPNENRTVTITWTPDSAGSYTIKINVSCENEPTIYMDDNEYSKKISVQPNQVKNAAIVIAVMVAVIVVAVVVRKIRTRKKEKAQGGEEKKQKKEEKVKKEKKEEKEKEKKE